MTFSPGASDLNLSNSRSGYPYVTACTARMADRIGPGVKTAVEPVGTESVPVAAVAAGTDNARRNTGDRCTAEGPADSPGSVRLIRFAAGAARGGVALIPRAAEDTEDPAATVAASPSDPSGRGAAAASPTPPITAAAPSAAVRTPTRSHRAPGATPTCRIVSILVRDILSTLLRSAARRSRKTVDPTG
jgi:hypothetical protein